MEHSPELDSEWPTFDLTEPTNSGVFRFLQNILSMAIDSSAILDSVLVKQQNRCFLYYD